ncbi:MAG: alpha/beta fold hydrolase, partial [Xanthomonadales bacterium]|nr:alpha/beta fold hydrolase [Xanthomonadales bacterium]
MTELPEALHTWSASGRRVLADGVSLYTRERGRGDWIVCVHGFPTSSWDWHRVMPGLARKHRVLVFDLPGFGLSEKPPGRDYSLLRQADAMEAL